MGSLQTKWRRKACAALLPLALGAPSIAAADAALVPHRFAPRELVVREETAPRFLTIRQALAEQRAGDPAALETWSLRLSQGDQPDQDQSEPHQPRSAPFTARGYGLFRSHNAAIANQWARVSAQWREERARISACRMDPSACTPAAFEALKVLSSAADAPPEARAELVHRRVNAVIRYRADTLAQGVADHWTSPLNALTREGDCEDYALAKYFLLREAGIAAADIRIVLLRDLRTREDHAVLAVRSQTGWTLYDNRYDLPESDQSSGRFRPVLLVHEAGIELYAAPFGGDDDTLAWGAAPARVAQAAPLPFSLRGAID